MRRLPRKSSAAKLCELLLVMFVDRLGTIDRPQQCSNSNRAIAGPRTGGFWMSIRLERRRFLKNAMASTLAAPVLASLGTTALGRESSKPAKAAKGPASPPRPALTLNVRDYGATGDGS